MTTKTLPQFEKNVSASFGYVKKDLLMMNDAISDLHDQIQHLSLNNASLLGKLMELEQRMAMNKKKTVKAKRRRK